MSEKRTVLITGAGGFLAGHSARAFREAGWRLVGIGRSDADRQSSLFDSFKLDDLSDAARIAGVFDKFTPSLVIHLAAPSSVPASLQFPLADFEAHVMPTARLYEAIRTSATPGCVMLISSAAVYGDPHQTIDESTPLRPISPYGFHKLQQESIADEAYKLHNIRSLKVRLFSTFGEGLRRLAVWEIAHRALRGDTTVGGTGDEVRDYLYAGDIAHALVTIAERAEFNGSAINVGAGEGTSIRSLASTMFDILGIQQSPRFTGVAAKAMPKEWIAGVEKLRALGFAPRHSLRDGLTRTLEWIKTQN